MTGSLEFPSQNHQSAGGQASFEPPQPVPQPVLPVELPLDITQAIEQKVQQSGQSQGQVILELLRSALGLSQPSNEMSPQVPTPLPVDRSNRLVGDLCQLKAQWQALEARLSTLESLEGKSIAF